MLASNFFKILSTTETENDLEVAIEINSNHEIFKGHFPGNPVVPGVCMVQMLTDVLNERHQQSLVVSSAKVIKFTQVINPIEAENLVFLIKEEAMENGWKVQAQLNSKAGNHFKCSGEFTVD